MLRAVCMEGGRTQVRDLDPAAESLPGAAVWIDAVALTGEEERALESWLGIDVPTREDMREIEASSRLYESDGAAFMTATLVSRGDTESPESTEVTFILVGARLLTLRYAEPRPFTTFLQQVQRNPQLCAHAELALAALLDSVVDRLADLLEIVGADLDGVSRTIFAPPGTAQRPDYRQMLVRIGRNGDLISKVQESLVSLSRLQAFARNLEALRQGKGLQARVKALGQDLASLTDHAGFLNGKVNFLLDATLGQIGIDQNAIIKIFSVVAVVFMPPTLVASIYGMNFQHMPELGWPFGYPLALLAMVVAAVLPLLYFKRKGWL